MIDDPVVLALTKYEALVLFEWLVKLDESEQAAPQDSAEQTVLWRVEAQLEKTLVAIIRPDYNELLEDARRRVLASR